MTAWHASEAQLATYALTPETVEPTTAASIESHLLHCDGCRRRVADVAASSAGAFLATSWDAIADRIDRPRPTLLERLAGRLGLSTSTARLVAGTTPLRAAWAGAVLGCLALALWLSHAAGSPGPYLAIAPLVPVLAVLVTFAPVAEPSGEAGMATPMAGIALTLRRIVAVEIPAVVIVGACTLLVPEAAATLGWLLPGVALAASTLALGTFVRVPVAAALSALAWSVAVAFVSVPAEHEPLVHSALFTLAGQLGAAVVVLGAGFVCWQRRHRFATLEVTW